MVARNEKLKPATVDAVTDREAEIARQQQLIIHARHQRRVGTITRMRKQELSHAQYGVRLAHYLTQPHRLTVMRWVTELRAFDLRAYQSKLAAIDITDFASYFWWFNLGDEQRYALIRASLDAGRDEAEQEKKYRRQEQIKKRREEDGW